MEAFTLLLNFTQANAQSTIMITVKCLMAPLLFCSGIEMDSLCNSNVMISNIQINMPLHLIDV